MTGDWCVVGVDPSARKLVAVISLGDEYQIVKRTMPKDIEARCHMAYRWVRDIIKRAPRPVAIFIEEPVFGAGGANGTLPLAKVHGAMLAAAMVAGADLVVPTNNQSWKKRIVGTIKRGSNHKTAISAHVRQFWNQVYVEADGDQDVCDAACINRYGVEILRLRRLLPAQGIVVQGRRTRATQRNGNSSNVKSRVR